MARVRSTARVEREGDETEASETVPISEAMQRSGLVTTEEMAAAGWHLPAAQRLHRGAGETAPPGSLRIRLVYLARSAVRGRFALHPGAAGREGNPAMA